MQSIRLSYSPTTASLTGYASNVTGGTWTLTNTSVPDGYAHTMTIQNNSATDHSAKTALITGTYQGFALTETVNLPAGSATVTSTKRFHTITSVVPSASIGADTMNIGYGASFDSGVICLDRRVKAVLLEIIVTGTINYTVRATSDDVWSLTNRNFNFLDSGDPDVVGATTSKFSNFIGAIPDGMLLLINSYTAGATIKINITSSK